MPLSTTPSAEAGRNSLPVIVVTGMAFEARIARGEGVEVVYAARADLLERASLPTGIKAEPLPTLTVRGRAAPLGIAALQRVGASS